MTLACTNRLTLTPHACDEGCWLQVVSVRYSFEDIELQGVVAYNTEAMGPQPVVMVAHDWNGLDQYEVWRAKYLAMQVCSPTIHPDNSDGHVQHTPACCS